MCQPRRDRRPRRSASATNNGTTHKPVGGRLRAPPVAGGASKKEWPRSKKSRKAQARRFFRAPQQDRRPRRPASATNGGKTQCTRAPSVGYAATSTFCLQNSMPLAADPHRREAKPHKSVGRGFISRREQRHTVSQYGGSKPPPYGFVCLVTV